MGYYLNSKKICSLYESEVRKPYFVDKTKMLKNLITLVEQGNNHICITRPRRFGKSVMASMIGSFFSRGFDSRCIPSVTANRWDFFSGKMQEIISGRTFYYRDQTKNK